MKVVNMIARILLGVIFVFFGANLVHPFLPMPPPTGAAAQFMAGLYQTHFLALVGLLQVVGGLLMIAGLYVTLGLVILGPMIVCIDYFHLLTAPGGLPMAAVVTVLWILVAYAHRKNLEGIFSRTA